MHLVVNGVCAEKVCGEYARKSGRKLTYIYDVTWASSGRNVSWMARVLHAGKIKGAMRGQVVGCPIEAAKIPVLDQIEHNIEQLIDIDE